MRNPRETDILLRMKHGTPFSGVEDTYLTENYIALDAEALAAKLRRPVASVRDRLRHLNLSKKKPGRQAQKKVSVFFDLELVPRMIAGADQAGLSLSAFVQETVRKALGRKKAA